MTTPYGEEQFWIKAKLFLNRAMGPSGDRTEDEKQLWAALALELLAKAALSKVSPILVAEPTADGSHALRAAGLIEGETHFTTARASTIFKRCQKAFRPFSEDEATKIASGRNEYLHGAALGITNIPAQAWWPRFWAQAHILLTAQGADISQLVGVERVDEVEAYLAQNQQNIEHQLTSRIETAKLSLARFREGRMSGSEQAKWQDAPTRFPIMDYHIPAECPACHGAGRLEGNDIVDRRVGEYGDHEGDHFIGMIAEIDVSPECFTCPTCHLLLDKYELIVAADLGEDAFTVEVDPESLDDWFEPEYGND
ncbi:hypothetical protein [Nocardia vaccinii]|uniref:hypothetical protein n=1 Tax=Nocardia vaccinii TaxID=1822 RepID=UPI0012F5103D|nr:hypothetical protein [Nocardia vaccinii]